jgi:hypothetical protein
MIDNANSGNQQIVVNTMARRRTSSNAVPDKFARRNI